jgi:hypothetical protein
VEATVAGLTDLGVVDGGRGGLAIRRLGDEKSGPRK